MSVVGQFFKKSSKHPSQTYRTPVLSRYEITQEDMCVGCQLCVKVCPADAIVVQSSLRQGVPHLDAISVSMQDCVSCDLCV